MVNHFATLLVNTNAKLIIYSSENYLLGADEADIVGVEADVAVALSDIARNDYSVNINNVLINRDFVKLQLPSPLSRFYDIVFPPTSSDYYKQFLLYCYLRILTATDVNKHIYKYDQRIAYNLDELQDYFTLPRISSAFSSDNRFKILLSGKLEPTESRNYKLNDFVISQVADSTNVWVYSFTQRQYYKAGVKPQVFPKNMEAQLSLAPNSTILTNSLQIGNTGLSFRLTGPFNEFLNTEDKYWLFSAEAPHEFDVIAKINDLLTNSNIVESMFDFGREYCDISYESIWRQHYNPVYRLAGLLLAYVDRVNLVWLNQM